ncbi:MAG: arylesterase [Burkholderiales bacterium]|nr:arylesterase [Opitutaceae bacterium]
MLRAFAALVFSITLACGLAAQAPATPALAPAPTQNILVLGDSLTAGYGLPDPSTQAFPALLQEKIDALAATTASSGLPAPLSTPPAPPRWRVVNAGLSGDTTSGGLRRIDWVLRQPVGILVLALGSNDGLRGLDPGLVSRNLAAIGAKVRAKNPEARILLVGQRMPTSMGDYAARFDAVFPALAHEQNWPLVPFLLEGVGGVRELNQADAIHPNETGHRRMADTVWTGLAPLLATP